MEILILSFLTALGKIWVISRVIGTRALVKWAKWFDVFFIFALPLLFMGTFSGATLAVLSGLWFTLLTYMLGWFVSTK
jgi:thiamine transporter ThiT